MSHRSGVKNVTVPQLSRKKRALISLETQLEEGTKTKKKTIDEKVPLTDSDIKRINKEIAILKTRIV